MPTFTVIGIYEDPMGQRYATTVQTETPEEAEVAAREEADPGLMVAGVVLGEVELADMYTDGTFNVPGMDA